MGDQLFLLPQLLPQMGHNLETTEIMLRWLVHTSQKTCLLALAAVLT